MIQITKLKEKINNRDEHFLRWPHVKSHYRRELGSGYLEELEVKSGYPYYTVHWETAPRVKCFIPIKKDGNVCLCSHKLALVNRETNFTSDFIE